MLNMHAVAHIQYTYMQATMHAHTHAACAYSQWNVTANNCKWEEHTSNHLQDTKGEWQDQKCTTCSRVLRSHRDTLRGQHKCTQTSTMHVDRKAYTIRTCIHIHTYFCIEHESPQFWSVTNVQNQDKQRCSNHNNTCRNIHMHNKLKSSAHKCRCGYCMYLHQRNNKPIPTSQDPLQNRVSRDTPVPLGQDPHKKPVEWGTMVR